MSYTKLFIDIKLIFIYNEFEIPGEISYTYNGSTKLKKNKILLTYSKMTQYLSV